MLCMVLIKLFFLLKDSANLWSLSILDISSEAAFLVNVEIMKDLLSFFLEASYMLLINAVVFPVPGPAIINLFFIERTISKTFLWKKL